MMDQTREEQVMKRTAVVIGIAAAILVLVAPSVANGAQVAQVGPQGVETQVAVRQIAKQGHVRMIVRQGHVRMIVTQGHVRMIVTQGHVRMIAKQRLGTAQLSLLRAQLR
jgi:hypothetical protein